MDKELPLDWPSLGLPADPRLDRAKTIAASAKWPYATEDIPFTPWPVLIESGEPQAVELVCADMLSGALADARASARSLPAAFDLADFFHKVHQGLGQTIADMTTELSTGFYAGNPYATPNNRKLALAHAIVDLRVDNEILLPPGATLYDILDALRDETVGRPGTAAADRFAREAYTQYELCRSQAGGALEALFLDAYAENRALAEMKTFERSNPGRDFQPS